MIKNLQNTYHYNHDIERVWSIIKNCEILFILSNKGHYPCINIKGKNTTKQYIKKRHNFYKHNEELIYENPLLPFEYFLNLLYVEYKRKQLAKEYKNKNLIGKDVENTVYYCC